MADPNIKVGAGYIEISPKLTGFNRTLTTRIKDELKKIGALEAVISPTLEKDFAAKLKLQIEQELKKLDDFEVGVKANLKNIDSFRAANEQVAQTVRNTATETAKSTKKIESDFDRSLSGARESIKKLDVAIRAGFRGLTDPGTAQAIDSIRVRLTALSTDVEGLSARQVASIRAGMRELEAMSGRIERSVKAEALAVQAAENDKIQARARAQADLVRSYAEQDAVQAALARESEALAREVAAVQKAVLKEVRAEERETERVRKESAKAAAKAMRELERETAALFKETDRLSQEASRSVAAYGKSFTTAAKTIFSTKEASKDFLNIGQTIETALKTATGVVASAGKSLGERFAGTFEAVAFGMLARGGIIAAFAALTAPSIISGVSSISAGLLALASTAAYAAGSLAAIPAVFALIGQGALVLFAGFNGITDALDALSKADDKSGAAAQAAAQAREAAAERVRSAQERLADAQLSAMERVEGAQERLTQVQEQAAERIAAAQERVTGAQDRLADAQENAVRRVATANEQVANAQERLAQAQEDAARRVIDAQEQVASAQERLTQSQEQAVRRVSDAQERLADVQQSAAQRIINAERQLQQSHTRTADALADLNRAREEAKERLEDLALAEASAALDEEAAQLAIERAAENLAEVKLNPKSSERDRREADLAHRQALLRLAEIKERNEDLRKEVEEANKAGVDGSKEVQSARDRLLKTQEEEIEAERALRDARKEAAADVAKAERDLTDARTEGSRQVEQAQKALVDAERNVTEARLDGARQVEAAQKAIAAAERQVTDARLDGARQVEAAQKAITDAELALAKARQDATKDVARAESEISKARTDGTRQVESAQRDLTAALAAQTEALGKTSVQAQNAEIALSKLSPAGRSFVLFLHDELIPEITGVQHSIQEAFLPPLQEALQRSSGLLDVFKEKFTSTATVFGDFALDFSEWLNTDESKNKIGRILDSNNRIFEKLGDAAIRFSDGLLTLTAGSGPFLERMADLVDRLAAKFAAMMQEADKSGRLQEFFGRVGDTIERLLSIAGDLGRGLFGVLEAAYPPGKRLLDLIGKNVEEFANWANSIEGQDQLRQWFEKGEAVMVELGLLVKDIVKQFIELGENVDFAAIVKTIREELLPAITSFIRAMSGDNGEGVIHLIETFATALEVATPLAEALAGILDILVPDNLNDQLTYIESSVKFLSGAFRDLAGDSEGASEDYKNALAGMDEVSRNTFGKSLPELWHDSKNKFDEFVDGVEDGWAAFTGDIDRAWEDAKTTVVQACSDLTLGAANKIQELRTSVGRKFDEIGDAADTAWTIIRETVKRRALELVNGAVEKFEELKTGARRKFDELLRWFSGIGTDIKNTLSNLGPSLWQAGNDMLQGFWNGVANKWNQFIDWWNRSIGSIEEIAKRILNINSPSRVMAEIGRGVGEGLAMGIEQTEKMVSNAVFGIADAVTGSWQSKDVSLPLEVQAHSFLPSTAEDTQRYGAAAKSLQKDKTEESTSKVGRVYNLTMNAAPTVPTERQIFDVFSYADALYS
ncbi:hypothetical protein ACFV0L_10400 [Streptosporangium canum]|uniref:hypothetical protein n=1 Tax=Streptosporangium canum TaxID=324952 RepID=UPI003682BBEC